MANRLRLERPYKIGTQIFKYLLLVAYIRFPSPMVVDDYAKLLGLKLLGHREVSV